MEIQFGLSKGDRKAAAEELSDFLASSYALYLKAQTFHYNVTGPEFFSLHLLFAKQYDELAEAVDEIAERIRSLGFLVDASLGGLKKRSDIQDAPLGISAKRMIQELVKGHEALSQMGRRMVGRLQEMKDEASADLLVKRLGVHEKASWMLRSHLVK